MSRGRIFTIWRLSGTIIEGNWRLDFNQKHRGDVYATHGLGPACQLLDIHRGDKMNCLVADGHPARSTG